MKTKISRQSIYLLILSTILLVFVLVFSFAILIPKGKEYRAVRKQLRQDNLELNIYKDFNDETQARLQKLQSEHRHIITAFGNTFNAERFEKQHRNYFNSLTLCELQKSGEDGVFTVFEVNTTSQINSPKSFYDFLDAINKSDWVIGINFPINFKREAEMIRSSFTMKVYSNTPEGNVSKRAN